MIRGERIDVPGLGVEPDAGNTTTPIFEPSLNVIVKSMRSSVVSSGTVKLTALLMDEESTVKLLLAMPPAMRPVYV